VAVSLISLIDVGCRTLVVFDVKLRGSALGVGEGLLRCHWTGVSRRYSFWGL